MENKNLNSQISLDNIVLVLSKLSDNIHHDLFGEDVYQLIGTTKKEVEDMIEHGREKFREKKEFKRALRKLHIRERRILLISFLLIRLHHSLGYRFIGQKPKKLLKLIKQDRGKSSQFFRFFHDADLDEIELTVYREADSKTYWEKVQEAMEELMPSPRYPDELQSVSYKDFIPVDLRGIKPSDLRSRLLSKLRDAFTEKRLPNTPIGKEFAKGRIKRDDLSIKNWPEFRKAFFLIYKWLKPFYPSPERHSFKLIKDIIRLFKNEYFYKQDGIKKALLYDLNERDLISAIQQYRKKYKEEILKKSHLSKIMALLVSLMQKKTQ